MASSNPINFSRRPADGETGVAEALRTDKTLDNLWIDGCGWFGDDDAMELGQALASHKSLRRLHLVRCAYTLRGLRGIAVALKKNTVLTFLNMSLNDIGDAGATALADGLASSLSLKELRLGVCGMGADGSRTIAVALKTNTVLECLDMSCNNIGDAGATALADALASSAFLRYLRLDSCSISKEGALALGRAVGGNLALATDSEICVEYNKIIRKEARRVRAFTLRRREQLLSFGMAMIPRLAAGQAIRLSVSPRKSLLESCNTRHRQCIVADRVLRSHGAPAGQGGEPLVDQDDSRDEQGNSDAAHLHSRHDRLEDVVREGAKSTDRLVDFFKYIEAARAEREEMTADHLVAAIQAQEEAPGTSREALSFDRMDRDVFKLIGEAYGHY